MGKYIEQLKERESLLNETSENYILEDNLKKSSSQMYGFTNPQKVQKVKNSTDIPTLTNPQKVQKVVGEARPPAPMRLLAELERRGLTPVVRGNALTFDCDEIPHDLRAPVVQHRAALVAVVRFREYAQTRARHEHWICPDERLLTLWREANAACQCQLTIAGNLRRQK